MMIGMIDEVTRQYAMGWDNAFPHRICIGLVGVIILVLAGRVALNRECSLLTGILWLIAGGILVTFSAYPQKVIEFVISKEYLTRIRVIMGMISLLVLYITFESIRRTHLQEKYALLWVATALVILISVLFPDAVALFRAVTGMEYATAIASVSFTFLVMVAFHFSISLSAIQLKQSRISQRVAILEARLKQMEDLLVKENNKFPDNNDNSQKTTKK